MLNEDQLLKICIKYEFVCPICYTSNAFFRLKRDICKALDREGDGHPQAWRWMVSGFDQIDPKLFMFGVCRRCFYTGELDDIEFRTSPKDPDAYRRQFPFEVLKGLSSRKDNPYNITKTLGRLAADETPIIGAIARFHLAIFSQCLREKIVPGQIARYYLRLAWLYRDQESYYAEADLEEVKRQFGALAKVWLAELPQHIDFPVKPGIALDEPSALRFSREFFQRNYQNLRQSAAEDELRLRFLLAEIGFRLYGLTDDQKDYKIATGYYSGTMQQCLGIISDKTITGGIINRARDMLEKCGERGRQLRQLQKDGGAKKTLGKNTHSKIESKVPKKKKRSSIELTTPKEQIVKAKKPRPETLKATLSANDPSSKALDLESQVHELREQVAELTADNEKWRALVGKDTLTGLFNKITLFRVVLPKALVKLETAGPFSFIAITLDEVAQANLDHGWFMGDRLIKLAVRRLAHFVGPDEELYRLDGTQFVITAKLDDNAGLVRATDIHQQLAQDRIDVDQITMPMRASIGVVTTKTMHGKDTLEMANAIYQGIVKVLYLARENGGNKVEFREISG